MVYMDFNYSERTTMDIKRRREHSSFMWNKPVLVLHNYLVHY